MPPLIARAQDIADWTTPSNPRRNNGRKGEVKSTKVSNKYDLLDDVETNVKAEIDEDEDEKKAKEKVAKSGKESVVRALPHRRHTLPRAPLLDSASRAPQFESVSPESVGGNGKAPRGSTPLTTDSVLAACIRRILLCP